MLGWTDFLADLRRRLVVQLAPLFLFGFAAAYGLVHGGSVAVWVVLALMAGPLVVAVAGDEFELAWAVLVAEAVLAFWATDSEPSRLLVRWLTYAALGCQAGATLGPTSPWALAGLSIELLAVTYGIPEMTLEIVDPWTTATVLVGLVLAWLLGRRSEQVITLRASERETIHNLQEAVTQLTTANSEFLGQAQQAGEESALSERHRITRDLHDVVGQTLTNITMMMDASIHRGPGGQEDTEKVYRWVRNQAQTGLEETRAVLYRLRQVRPSAPRGVKAFQKLFQTFSRLSKVRVEVHWGNLPWTFDPNQERAVHHLLQAALSNAYRHGVATQIDVQFQVIDSVLHLAVRDNGKGGSTLGEGIGQQGMSERLTPWNGQVWFQSAESGYTVYAELPLLRESPEDTGDHHVRP